MTIVLLALGIFVIAAAGLSTDVANLFMHKQLAQSAANSACTAGAMDLMVNAQSNALGGFTAGTNFACSSNASAAPCKYAALNGYSGTGLVANMPSNDVRVSFPAGANCPGDGCPAPGITPVSSAIASSSFIRVDVVDRAKVILYGLLTGAKTVDVRAYAVCGLAWSNSPVPLLILNPSSSDTFAIQGNPSVTIVGGPVRSIQVNSSSSSAVSIGGSASVDLTKGGPNFNGSDFGVFGGPSTPPGGFTTANQGSWRYPSSPIFDPYALTPAPAKNSLAPAVPDDLKGRCSSIPCSVTHTTHGCPDPGGCDLYTAGYYASGISVKKATAIFDPGVYYLNGGLALQANSLVRPGTGVGDGSQGTVFFLTGDAPKCSGQTGLVCVGSNSGKGGVDDFVTSTATCTGGSPPDSRIGLPATLSGNVLLAPCTGTYGDPSGLARGILFFGDRASGAGGGWGGGGGFLLVGSIYFHHCNAMGTGTGCSAPPNYYDAVFNFQGNSGTGSYVLGDIVTDNLSMGGNPSINMALDPGTTRSVLKASLFF